MTTILIPGYLAMAHLDRAIEIVKHGDPFDGEMRVVTPEQARDIGREDASLLGVTFEGEMLDYLDVTPRIAEMLGSVATAEDVAAMRLELESEGWLIHDPREETRWIYIRPGEQEWESMLVRAVT